MNVPIGTLRSTRTRLISGEKPLIKFILFCLKPLQKRGFFLGFVLSVDPRHPPKGVIQNLIKIKKRCFVL